MTVKPLVVPQSGRLDDIARGIHGDVLKGRAAYDGALDCYLSIGHQLKKARALLESDQAFGTWFKAQQFGFSQQWGHTLRQAAEYEPAIRDEVTTQVVTGGQPNIKKAVQAVVPAKPKAVEPAPEPESVAPTSAPIRPPPPDAVQGPDDHTYDMARINVGLFCLPGCPGPEPHKIAEGGSQAAEVNGEQERVAPVAVAPQPTQEVGEGEASTREGDGAESAVRPSPASGFLTSPSSDQIAPSPGVAPPADTGVPSAVGDPGTAVGSPTKNSLAIDTHAFPVGLQIQTDEWAVLVRGTNPEQFQALSAWLLTTDCKWECVGEVGEGQFSVEVA